MLEIRNVTKVFNPGTVNEKVALNNFSLTLDDGDFVTVIGGNGAGKSTMMNAIAGVWLVDSGQIIIDGEDVTKLSEHKRAKFLGRVFQDPMTGTAATMGIEENLALAKRRGRRRTLRPGISKKEREEYKELLKILGLGLEERLTSKVGLLSGGQRQRVAMGRAIVRHPKVLLMDEPLSNLDAKLRGQMRVEISRLHEKLGSTIVYVTHDQTEAMTLGDRIVVMSDGEVQQIDTPQNLYDSPVNKFVAGFIGEPPMNFFRGEVKNGSFVGHGLTLDITPLVSDIKSVEGKKVVFAFRPEAIKLTKTKGDYEIKSKVELTELLGDTTNVYATVGEGDEKVNVILKVNPHNAPEMGAEFKFRIPQAAAYIYDAETEEIVENSIKRH